MTLSPTVALARQLIQCQSVTPDDAGCQEILRARLQPAGFVCEAMKFEDVDNLWARRGDAKPLLTFAGHTDVVPTGPLDAWTYPPFAGEVCNGMLHGRGAADMKGGVAAFVTACERFVAQHPQHAGAIALLITSDEEGVAKFGTRAVMETLTARGEKIDLCIVGEPSSEAQLGDTIKVGRRGSCGAKIIVRGVQGHIAYLADNPIHRAIKALAELLAVKWDDGDANFPPTSFHVSNINAGTGASNVIPGEVVIDFNLRYSPQVTHEKIRARVEQALTNHDCEYEINWDAKCPPFASKQGAFTDAVCDAIKSATGITAKRSTAGGTSDGRFIAPTGAEVLELGPLNETIHQINECVSTEDLDQLSAIYEAVLIKMLAR